MWLAERGDKKHFSNHVVNEKRRCEIFWWPDGSKRQERNDSLTPYVEEEVMEDS
jgi:hypothetical protein